MVFPRRGRQLRKGLDNVFFGQFFFWLLHDNEENLAKGGGVRGEA